MTSRVNFVDWSKVEGELQFLRRCDLVHPDESERRCRAEPMVPYSYAIISEGDENCLVAIPPGKSTKIAWA